MKIPHEPKTMKQPAFLIKFKYICKKYYFFENLHYCYIYVNYYLLKFFKLWHTDYVYECYIISALLPLPKKHHQRIGDQDTLLTYHHYTI